MRNFQQLSTLVLVLLVGASMGLGQKPERVGYSVSKFGKYVGYSQPLYKEWVRQSRYIEMSDGIKLAMDIIRPAKNGKVITKPMPVIWNYYLYVRAEIEEGKVISMVDISETLQNLVRHGYIIVVVDARGKGASYGRNFDPVTADEGKYGYEITEWLAAQPWCDGNVGMFGHSYSANMQFMVAGHAPPHLKAIFPSMGAFDIYQLLHPGGICREIILEKVTDSFQAQEAETQVAPVDEDNNGDMLAEAKKQHEDNVLPIEYSRLPYRSSEEGELKPWTLNNPMAQVQAVSKSGVAVYQWTGWFDAYARDAWQWLVNLKNPQKITCGPWAHGDYDPIKKEERYRLYATEMLRWFDYWLKGIDNGIMNEPRINYAIMDEGNKWSWHSADRWPLPEVEVIEYYFSEGKSGSVNSRNDELLLSRNDEEHEGEDIYPVDYTTTVGEFKGPRCPDRGLEDPDMTSNDVKGLTYTTPPLEDDITVAGHPVVTLYVKSTASDGNFYAYLEEIDPDGYSHYITDGLLRASNRAESVPPFYNMGLPFHTHFEEDVQPISEDEVIRLSFDMMPTANLFNKGHRIRVTITCANAGWDKLPSDEPATVTLMRNARFPSHVALPTIKNEMK
jgi:putative CocE/NonD family hydrolase